MKIYSKRGAKNYKENKILKELEPILSKKFNEDKEFASHFQPAENYEQLMQLHKRYTGEEVEFEDIKKDFKEELKSNNDMVKSNSTDNVYSENPNFIDPFNREEPIVRDYVLKNEFESTKNDSGKNDANTNTTQVKTEFAEPVSFNDAFQIPEDEPISVSSKQDGGRKNYSNMGGMGNPNINSGKKLSTPVNPDFDSMGDGNKKKKTRKFAKYIVGVVTALTERGFVWYANKDINETKLAEYELTGEYDLNFLLTLAEGQQVSVKQFFQNQCYTAEQMAKISEEEKSDLADALAEVLLEKGIAPTPTQELMLISAQILGVQALKLYALTSQTKALLNQLRVNKEERVSTQTAPEPPTQSQMPKTSSEPIQEPEPKTIFNNYPEEVVNEVDNIHTIFDDGVKTIE